MKKPHKLSIVQRESIDNFSGVSLTFLCSIYANDNIYILDFNRFSIYWYIRLKKKPYHQSQDVIRSMEIGLLY